MKSATIRTSSHSRNATENGKGIILFIIFLFITAYSFSQQAAYLDFRNPSLESGTGGADGAQYRFSNVTTNVDAIVTITGRSDVLVNVLNMDMNTSGFDGAFQPQVGYNNGTTPGAADWWMQFNIRFVTSGTTTPVSITEFNVSGVDIDGNGQYINEYASFFGMQDYSVETGTGLSVTSLYENIDGTMQSGKRFDGPTANYTNIDTGATAVMVTNHYVNKSSFTVRAGGRSTDVSGAADRMYSFYFQNFTYNSPSNVLLAMNNARLRRSRLENNAALKVFPNPGSGNINIAFPDSWDNSNVSVRIYDTNGALVVNPGFVQNNRINISQLKTGVYMIHFSGGNSSGVQRIVKM